MNSVTLNHTPVGDERPAPNAMSRLQQIRVPTLVVWGDLDFEHIQKRSAQIAATVPGAEAFPMAGTAHLPNLEEPKAFVARLKKFLDRA